MRRFTVLLLVTLTVVSPFLAVAARASGPVAALDAYVARGVEEWQVPGLAIAVVKDGEVVLARGYGVRQLGVGGVVDQHTLFAIGSTTKAMTAATVGLLVDAGELDWGDRVIDHWPGFRLGDPWMTREVTVRELLTHNAGLANADMLWYGTDRSRQEVLARIPHIRSAYSPRDGFLYQNIMYIAAGALAGSVVGTSWEELTAERLFAPLEMARTVPTLAATAGLDNVARPHDTVDGELVPIDNASVDAAGPAGSVWSSVSDMTHWLRMLLAEGRWGDRRVLSKATVAELLRPQTLLDISRFYPYVDMLGSHWSSYGLAWFQLDYRGRFVAFHTGSIDGMAAMVGLVPDEELGVVILQNRDHAELRHALLWKTIDLWTGVEDGRDWSAELQPVYDERVEKAAARRQERAARRVPDTSPSLPLERYAGRYRHGLYEEFEITLAEGDLRLDLGPDRRGSLEHWHYDTFELRFDRRWQSDALVTFALDADGEPASVELFGLRFERVRGE